MKPMSNAEVRRMSRRKIEELRAAGIEWVEVLGCAHPPDECEALRAMQGNPVEIQYAPELPLPNCDKKHCKCIILASEGPDKVRTEE